MKVRTKRILAILLLFIVAVFCNGCYFVFNGQFKSAQKLKTGQELSVYECFSVYSMHCAVWLFGWPIAPEAAHECFLLHFPTKRDTIRFKRTLDSPKVRESILSLQNKPTGASARVSWSGNVEYALNSLEHRAAIAVNPCTIIKTQSRKDGGKDEFVIVSSSQYPKWSDTQFNLGFITIHIQEGLFRYLQDHRWLSHSYIEYNAPVINE